MDETETNLSAEELINIDKQADTTASSGTDMLVLPVPGIHARTERNGTM